MSRRSIAYSVLLLAIVTGLYFGIRSYRQYQQDRTDAADLDALKVSWKFDPNDPSLLEVRLIAVNGDTLTIGFPTIVQKGQEKVVDYIPTSAVFLDMGAPQIHMASNPDATLKDIPLGSTLKIRAGADGTNPGTYDIYDIYVLQ